MITRKDLERLDRRQRRDVLLADLVVRGEFSVSLIADSLDYSRQVVRESVERSRSLYETARFANSHANTPTRLWMAVDSAKRHPDDVDI